MSGVNHNQAADQSKVPWDGSDGDAVDRLPHIPSLFDTHIDIDLDIPAEGDLQNDGFDQGIMSMPDDGMDEDFDHIHKRQVLNRK